MPTYQYACTACNHRFEAFQSFSDASLTECPECGGKLRKLFGNVGVVFKGSGFYRTDSRSESKASNGKPAAAASGSSDSAGSSNSSGSSGSDSGKGSTSSSSGSAGSSSTSTSAAAS